jgi:hypothetical protein
MTWLFAARSAVLLRLKCFASANTRSEDCTAFSELNEKKPDGEKNGRVRVFSRCSDDGPIDRKNDSHDF